MAIKLRNQLSAAVLTLTMICCPERVDAATPCDLQGKCKLIDSVEFMDEVGSGSIRLIDENNRELLFSYFNKEVHLRSGARTIKSEAGSPEERCLLKVLKKSYAATYDPAFDKDPGGDGTKRFLEQHAVKHFMRLLEQRCATR